LIKFSNNTLQMKILFTKEVKVDLVCHFKRMQMYPFWVGRCLSLA
jgi:hypothetical protein